MNKGVELENLLKKISKSIGWNIEELTPRQKLLLIKKIKKLR